MAREENISHSSIPINSTKRGASGNSSCNPDIAVAYFLCTDLARADLVNLINYITITLQSSVGKGFGTSNALINIATAIN